MKKVVALSLAVMMALMLCACDEAKQIGRDAQDAWGKYANQIEDSKEQIEDSFEKFQGILDEYKSGSN